jgi:hypothetical protein
MKAEKLSTQGATVYGKPFNLISEASIKKCLKYSEAPDALRSILEGLDITATLKQVAFNESWQDKKERACYSVAFSNGLTFDFWQSLNFKETMFADTYRTERDKVQQMKQEEINSFLYSVLCCVRSDSECPDFFEDFCSDFGYDTDSRKAENLHRECVKQARKVRKVFSSGQLSYFPQ